MLGWRRTCACGSACEHPPPGTTFVGGQFGGSCSGNVYAVAGKGWAFCDSGKWAYTTTNPTVDGFTPQGSGGSGGTSGSACGATLAEDDYDGCATCTWSPTASPGESMCTSARSVNACCDWVQAPMTTLARATGLHDYSSTTGTTVDFSCLTTPPKAGPVKSTTLSGYVKIFSSQTDTQGVKVEVFNVDTKTGALGAQVGASYTTTATDASETNTWLNACTSTPCTFRKYTISGVPTETPLVIKTSDAGMGLWSTLYDYNIYFSDAFVCGSKSVPTGAPCVDSTGTQTSYDATAVDPSDLTTAASVAGGYILNPSKGELAGEVHDCGDVRISGANVDTDQAHDGPMFYFGDNESDPTPDASRATSDEGTSVLGLFAALNIGAGVPMRVSAIGNVGGMDTLLGTTVVQVFAGPSVTAVSLRGRRAYQ